ncbi:sialic acid-binding Ig-like lectin 14, partial [Python bivittatus]|uniref:Sialic acid-binding Ig-like lectin 14 n=1 Tax=Python bivittatus TaxID=176946 RepID=A0A9F2RFH8_PYTBI
MDCPLQVLILELISTLLFWEGASPLRLPGYDLSAPANVVVEEGLCTIIPCNFTYDPSDASQTATLYGFWFGKRGFPGELPLVATNSDEMVASFAVNRFHLIGNLKEGNCSLLIFTAEKNDSGSYVFRMEKGYRAKFTFKDNYPEPFLKVT